MTLSPLYTWRGAVASPDSNLSPTQRHVALTLSLHMSERGDSCFPSMETQAAETGLSVSTVREALRVLDEKGWLVREISHGRGRSNRYTATIPENRQEPVVSENHRETAGEDVLPSKDLLVQTQEVKGIVERPPDRPARVDGLAVKDAEYELAHAILGVFNEIAGTRYHGKGWINKIVMRIREEPTGTLDHHRTVIARAFADPWWRGAPSPSVIYGNQDLFQQMVVQVGVAPKERGMTPEEMEAEGLKREWTAEAQAAEFEQRHG